MLPTSPIKMKKKRVRKIAVEGVDQNRLLMLPFE